MINKKFNLAGRPIGRPISDDDFEYIEEDIRDIKDAEVLLENLVIEFQPAQKGWMEQISNYVAPLEIGDCLLYTSPSPRDATLSRMPSSA